MQGTMTTDTVARETVSKTWWVILLWGIATAITGFMLIFTPGMTTLILIQTLAIFWLVGAIFDIVSAFMNRQQKGWIWRIVGAALSILVAIIILTNPIAGAWATLTLLFYFLAFSAIVNGIVNMFVGNTTRNDAGRDWSWGSFLLGLLQLLIGIYLLWHPLAGTLVLIPILGGVLIVFGIGAIFMSFRVKSLPA
jgi:uncharacterized membrane protein HdeD (DUF308 family)